MISINPDLWIKPEKASGKSRLIISPYLIKLPILPEHHLLINGLTGAIDIINESENADILLSRTFSHLSKEKISALIDRGHIICKEQLINCVQSLSNSIEARNQLEPAYFFLCPTNYCPMGCDYCIEGEEPKRASQISIGPDMVKSAFLAMEKLCQLAGRTSYYIFLFGGEPLQSQTIRAVDHILQETQKRGIKIFIFSNGIELESYVELLGPNKNIIDGLSVTIDGDLKYHDSRRSLKGAFTKTVKAIDAFRSTEIPIVIRTNLGLSNLHQVKQLRLFYEKKGWWNDYQFAFELTPKTNHGNLAEGDILSHDILSRYFISLLNEDSSYSRFDPMGLFSYLYYISHKLNLCKTPNEIIGSHKVVPKINGCMATSGASFTLSSSGKIGICNELVSSDKLLIGRYWPSITIDSDSLDDWKRRGSNYLKSCSRCKYRYFCGGGCALSFINGIGHEHNCKAIANDFEGFIKNMADEIRAKWI